MTRRKQRLRIAAVLGLVALVIGPGLYRRYRVDYHRARLRLWKEHKLADAWSIDKLPIVRSFFPPSPPFVEDTKWENEQAEKHRAALVELGELETERFVLKHLEHTTPEGRDFMRFLWERTHRLDLYWASPSWNQPTPLEFTFWCERGEMEKWRQFFAKYDVPNYWEIRDQSLLLKELGIEEM
jgi:hypothetical protein